MSCQNTESAEYRCKQPNTNENEHKKNVRNECTEVVFFATIPGIRMIFRRVKSAGGGAGYLPPMDVHDTERIGRLKTKEASFFESAFMRVPAQEAIRPRADTPDRV